MEDMGEECGIAGIYLKNRDKASSDAPSYLVEMLLKLQHRGQRSAGISIYNPRFVKGREKILSCYKGVGRVSEVFKIRKPHIYQKIMEENKGVAGIGHTRYSTSGNRDDYSRARNEAQPFMRRHPRTWKRFSLAFNGNIANYDELAKEIEKEDYILDTGVDTEVIMNLFSLGIKSQAFRDEDERNVKPETFQVIHGLMNKLDGAYNVLSLFADGNLIAFRDPYGFRPMVFGENKDVFAIASESVALEKIGIKGYSSINPGSAIIYNGKEIREKQIMERKNKFCHFELVYFMRANSKFDNCLVEEIRENLGKELALIEPLKDKLDSSYLVVAAPKTAIPAAEAYSKALNIERKDSIEKMELERGFINGEEERKRIMDSVYEVHERNVKGKKIIFIDDSLVRGETSKRLISQLRKAGATEVHFRSTEPPIKYPCCYGIDFPTREELLANRYNKDLENQIGNFLEADSVVFQTLDGLIRASGISKDNLCLACLNREYPTQAGQRLYGNLVDYANK